MKFVSQTDLRDFNFLPSVRNGDEVWQGVQVILVATVVRRPGYLQVVVPIIMSAIKGGKRLHVGWGPNDSVQLTRPIRGI